MADRSKFISPEVAEQIKMLRLNAGMTQKELAKRLHKSESAIRMWELGKSEPDVTTLRLLAKTFDTTVGYIANGELTLSQKAIDHKNNRVGNVVRQLRGEMSLRDFARKCDVSHTSIDAIEKGYDFRTGNPVQVKVVTLCKIAKACNVTVSWFLGENLKTTDELKMAVFGCTDATDEMLKQVLDYAKFLLNEHRTNSERGRK